MGEQGQAMGRKGRLEGCKLREGADRHSEPWVGRQITGRGQAMGGEWSSSANQRWGVSCSQEVSHGGRGAGSMSHKQRVNHERRGRRGEWKSASQVGG